MHTKGKNMCGAVTYMTVTVPHVILQIQMNDVKGNITFSWYLGVFKPKGPRGPILFEWRGGETDYTLASNPAQ